MARETTAVRLVKIDDTTSGNWKGVYGADGAMLVGDKRPRSSARPGARRSGGRRGMESGVWTTSANDVRALQKFGDAKDRMAGWWSAGWNDFKLDLEITDGKEHQVALYCLDWDKCAGGR